MAKSRYHLRQRILEGARRDAHFLDIAEESGVLGKLSVEVYPQFEEVDFYGGYRSPEHDYIPQSVTSREEHEKQKRFMKVVELSDVFSKSEQRHITFVGPAGSGKTTLLKAITRNVIGGKYPELRDVQYVHFLQGRNLYRNYKLTPTKLLLHNVEPPLDAQETQDYISLSKSNPERFLFIIDSLDTLPYALEEEKRKIGMNDQAFPGTILWNLLVGNIFAGCRVITSSREHAIRNYRGKLQADKVVALVGLTNASIRLIIEGYLGENEAKVILQYLETKSPALMNLASIPVFLAFILIGYKTDTSFTPRTMTGVLVLVIKSLMKSKHAHVRNIVDVINKLKRLAFDGTKDKRVLFSTTELGSYDLDELDVNDLTILAPGGQSHKLLVVETSLFFNHQSIQELLCAFFIAEMDLKEFKIFIEANIHNPHYAVVRRLLCGIMLDVEVRKTANELFERMPGDQHFLALQQTMRQQLELSQKSNQLELLISIHESSGGMDKDLLQTVRTVDLSRVPLPPSDIHAVGSVVSRCTQLEELILNKCSLTANTINILDSALDGSRVQIASLDASNNDRMGTDGVAKIGTIAKRCRVKKLALWRCGLSATDVQALGEALNGATLDYLNFTSNDGIGVEGVTAIANIVRKCGVKSLELRNCKITAKGLRAFNVALGDAKVTSNVW